MNRKIVVLATLALLFSVVAVVSEAGAQDQQPEVLWSQRIGFQPIDIEVGDLNGDSRPDVVVGYSEPAIVAIDSGGDVLWRFATRRWVWHVAVGDIDGDGRDDVAAYDTYPNNLYAISGSGAELWSYRLPATGNIQIGDVTGDGRNEVIVGTDLDPIHAGDSSALFVFDNQGSVLFRFSVPSFILSIVLADVTGDDGLEVVISYGYICPPCGVRVIDGSGNLVWDFSTPVRPGEAVAGDLNNDGKADVVVAESDFGARNVYAIDSSGSFLWRFEQEAVFGFGLAALALGDIDDDGSLNIVLGSADHHIYVLDTEGQVKWAFETGSDVSQIAVGDLDGDGRNEIAASTIGPPSVWPRTGVYAIDSNGSQRWFFPKSAAPSVQGFRDLVIADVNNDGRAEVVAIQDEQASTGDDGLVVALSTPIAEHITVDIDIKPGGAPNSINRRSRGRIPVAILSSPTFDSLSKVDTGSLTFGRTGDEPSLAFCNPEDVNGDRLLDVVCHFHTETTGFVAGDIQGVLKGKTRSGVPINGTDSVRIVP